MHWPIYCWAWRPNFEYAISVDPTHLISHAFPIWLAPKADLASLFYAGQLKDLRAGCETLRLPRPPAKQDRLVITTLLAAIWQGSFSCLRGINVTRGFSLPKSASDTAVLFEATICNDPAMLLARSSLITLVKSFGFVKYLLSFKGLVFLVIVGRLLFNCLKGLNLVSWHLYNQSCLECMHSNIRVVLGPRLKYRTLYAPSTAMILSSTRLPCKDNGNNFLLDAISWNQWPSTQSTQSCACP